MTPTTPPAAGEVPVDWDALRELPAADPPGDHDHDPAPSSPPAEPSALLLAGSAWGDLVLVLALTTAAVVAVAALGYRPAGAALPWALALAVIWWILAAAACLTVRLGSPGMLLAGVVFARSFARRRTPWVIVACLAQWLTLGLPAVVGSRRSPLRLAAGEPLVRTPDRLSGPGGASDPARRA